MLRFLPSRQRWTATPSWGAATVASLGCTLLLLLGLSGHPGFLWASIGAFLAAQAAPLQRFGMLHMLLLTLLAAGSASLGFRCAPDPFESFSLFATAGLLLVWLQRFGRESGKLGFAILAGLCLGQGRQSLGSMSNPYAVATLLALGGFWMILLAFSLRGLHGLPLWPPMPRFPLMLKVVRRHATQRPPPRWWRYALGCSLACGLAGLLVNLSGQPYGYWLTLAVVGGLQIDLKARPWRALTPLLATPLTATLLLLAGPGLQDPSWMIALAVPLLLLNRAFQAGRYSLYVLQTVCCLLWLAESLTQDWQLGQERLQGSLEGALLALLAALPLHGGRWFRERAATRSGNDALLR